MYSLKREFAVSSHSKLRNTLTVMNERDAIKIPDHK